MGWEHGGSAARAILPRCGGQTAACGRPPRPDSAVVCVRHDGSPAATAHGGAAATASALPPAPEAAANGTGTESAGFPAPLLTAGDPRQTAQGAAHPPPRPVRTNGGAVGSAQKGSGSVSGSACAPSHPRAGPAGRRASGSGRGYGSGSAASGNGASGTEATATGATATAGIGTAATATVESGTEESERVVSGSAGSGSGAAASAETASGTRGSEHAATATADHCLSRTCAEESDGGAAATDGRTASGSESACSASGSGSGASGSACAAHPSGRSPRPRPCPSAGHHPDQTGVAPCDHPAVARAGSRAWAARAGSRGTACGHRRRHHRRHRRGRGTRSGSGRGRRRLHQGRHARGRESGSGIGTRRGAPVPASARGACGSPPPTSRSPCSHRERGPAGGGPLRGPREAWPKGRTKRKQ